MLFGAYLMWHFGLWTQLVENDRTYLSSAIMLIFLLASFYLGWRAWQLGMEQRLAEAVLNAPENESKQQQGWATDYFRLQQLNSGQALQGESLQARLVEQVHNGHSSGWFISDLLLRLGLIGTVIGFVLMLGSVYSLQAEGVNALKQLLTSMGGGMQVALYTTLTGLSTAILTSIQCHWLDRCADSLVSRIIEIGVTKSVND